MEKRLTEIAAKCDKTDSDSNKAKNNINKRKKGDDNVLEDEENFVENGKKAKYSNLKQRENSYEDQIKEKLKNSKEDNLSVYDAEINKILKSVINDNDMNIDEGKNRANKLSRNKDKSRVGDLDEDNSVFPLLFIEKSIKKLDNDLFNLQEKVYPDLLLNL